MLCHTRVNKKAIKSCVRYRVFGTLGAFQHEKSTTIYGILLFLVTLCVAIVRIGSYIEKLWHSRVFHKKFYVRDFKVSLGYAFAIKRMT